MVWRRNRKDDIGFFSGIINLTGIKTTSPDAYNLVIRTYLVAHNDQTGLTGGCNADALGLSYALKAHPLPQVGQF
jgi:hypothetical protein